MAITPTVVDVEIGTLDQTPGSRAGPIGRLKDMSDCQVRHYTSTAATLAAAASNKVVVEAREGFSSLVPTLRSALDGTVKTSDWANPTLLEPFDDQLLSIANTRPRVYNGDSWTYYSNNRVLTRTLEETVWHTTDRTVQAPDSATFAGVTCSVWTETTIDVTGKPLGTTYVGFRADDGAWIRTPTVLYSSNDPTRRTMAHVVTDGTYAWVMFNDRTTGFQLTVRVYDSNGVQLGTLSWVGNWTDSPGYWDIFAGQGVVIVAEPGGYNPPNDVHVTCSTLTYSSGTITKTSTTDASMHSQGPVQWLTNDIGDGFVYLATVGASNHVYGYKINPSTRLKTHEYDVCTQPAMPDSLTGYVIDSGGGNSDLQIGISQLATAQTVGPKFDPQLRYTQSWLASHTVPGNLTRQTNSVIQVSRAFMYNALGEYATYTYYQSGSGLTLTQNTVPWTWTSGDYMKGAADQPIVITPGVDYATGAPFTTFFPGGLISPSDVTGSTGIGAGDTVGALLSPGSLSPVGLPTGSPVLRWRFAGGAFSPTVVGGQLVVSGSSGVVNGNGTYDIYSISDTSNNPTSGPTTIIWTGPRVTDGVYPGGTFGAAGNFVTNSFVVYPLSTMLSNVNAETAKFFVAGTMVVTGTGSAVDDGTKTIRRVTLGDPTLPLWIYGPAMWVAKTSEVTHVAGGGATAVVSPQSVNWWNLNNGTPFDPSYVGEILTISGDTKETANNGSFAITSTGGSVVITGGADSAGQVAEVFTAPVPIASITLADPTTAYTFYLQSITPNYTYVGGYITVSNSAYHAADNGTYLITGFNAAAHLIYATPTNGKTDQVNQRFLGAEVITIFLKSGINPETQPTWLLTPMTGSQPQVGRFEAGLAFADWRFEGETTYFGPNVYPFSVSSVSDNNNGTNVMLPYRARSFTAGQLLSADANTLVNIAATTSSSTVGLKQFTLSNSQGLAVPVAGEMLLPGPQAGGFSASGFHENGINISAEAPFTVSQETDSSSTVIGLTPGAKYIYQVVFYVTDESGDRVLSVPSQPLEIAMSGTNNTHTLGGRLVSPLGTTGAPITNTYGPTNRSVLAIAIYRTAVINGTPTVNLYTITNPLNVNGMYSGGGSGSGFTFPDSFSWRFRDQIADAQIVTSEVIYTGQGLIPRFPAPPSSAGEASCFRRTFVCGYDGAVWMSGEKNEGDGTWFFPGFRFTFGDDSAVCCAQMDQYLIVFCKKSVWYIPSAAFPNATLTTGALPNPVRLPFNNGGTGFCKTIKEGVVYSSTSGTGQLWIVTRNLQNFYFSENVQDDLPDPITGMTVDSRERLYVNTAGANWLMVYDGISRTWYKYKIPSNSLVLTSFNGNPTYQDSGFVLQQVRNTYADVRNGVTTPIPPDFTLASLSFAQVRGFVVCWAMQLCGEYKGPHNLNAVISYPDENEPDTVFPAPSAPRYAPDPSLPYLMEINPMFEEASSYGLRVFASFEGIGSPGNSFTMDIISCEVGVDRGAGLNQLPDGRQVAGG